MNADEERFEKAWKEFCGLYHKFGGRGKNEKWGGHFRVESDIVFHLAKLADREFGTGFVHINSTVSPFYFDNFKKRKQHVDIDITDPEKFSGPINTKHGIFVEVKWIAKDFRLFKYGNRDKDKIEAIQKDMDKLSDNKKNGRCEIAYMCIIDDENVIKDEQITEWRKNFPEVNVLVCPHSRGVH